MNIPAAILIVFILLKLYGTISWSWLWVLCPLWVPLAGYTLLQFLNFMASDDDDFDHFGMT